MEPSQNLFIPYEILEKTELNYARILSFVVSGETIERLYNIQWHGLPICSDSYRANSPCYSILGRS